MISTFGLVHVFSLHSQLMNPLYIYSIDYTEGGLLNGFSLRTQFSDLNKLHEILKMCPILLFLKEKAGAHLLCQKPYEPI